MYCVIGNAEGGITGGRDCCVGACAPSLLAHHELLINYSMSFVTNLPDKSTNPSSAALENAERIAAKDILE